MKTALFLFISIIFFSCVKKKEDVSVPFSEATYKVIITTNWVSPKFAVPGGAHFTNVIGMVHSKDTFLWKPGILATPGLEDVAEVGNNTKMNAELDVIILKNKALSKFNLPAPAVTGMIETNLLFNTNHPYISFASMIAPSPDWFMGMSNFSLLNDKTWIKDITADLVLYDAGTEDGDVFGYANPETTPRQNIRLLTPANASVLANGNASIAAIGTVRFIKN